MPATVHQSTAQATKPLLLTPRDAAAELAISERTLWGLTKRKELPCVRIGKSVRYRPADLEKFAADRAKASR